MNHNNDFIFSYLRHERININEGEFLFQMQSHPDYPSLLSISDTLHFFNINNGTFRIDPSEIHLLPKRFAVTLKEGTQNQNDLIKKEPEFYLVEKIGNDFYLKNNTTQKISYSQLKSRWDGIVMLLEEKMSATTGINNGNELSITYALFTFSVFCFSALIFLDSSPVTWKLFALFPIIGFLFSLLAAKDLFGIESELIEKFCNLSSDSNCSSVLKSKKWKIFDLVSLSDLSLVFFTTQLIAFLIYISAGAFLHYFSIQKLLLIIALPVIPISLYYQKFVEKKWCPICLAIIVTLIIEIAYLLFFVKVNFIFPVKSLALFGTVLFSVFLAWRWIKNNLIKIKELKEYNIKSNRFIRNYKVFRRSLVSQNRYEIPYTPLLLGGETNKLEISIITSPFCGFCTKAHQNLNEILRRNPDYVKIKILFNADLKNFEDRQKSLYRNLLRIFLDDGETAFKKSLDYWFDNKDIGKWLDINVRSFEHDKADQYLAEQHKWCVDNKFNFTPAVFINGYAYPQEYDLENLEYYINELIEDTDL